MKTISRRLSGIVLLRRNDAAASACRTELRNHRFFDTACRAIAEQEDAGGDLCANAIAQQYSNAAQQFHKEKDGYRIGRRQYAFDRVFREEEPFARYPQSEIDRLKNITQELSMVAVQAFLS